MAVLAVDASDELQDAQRRAQLFGRSPPFRHAPLVERQHRQGLCPERLVPIEDPDFGPLDVMRVVVVDPEEHGLARSRADRARIGGHAEPSLHFEIVELESDIRRFEGDVGTALDVGGAATRIVDRLPVDGDPHQIQRERVARLQRPRDGCDLDAVVVVDHRGLVVHDLDHHMGGVALEEAAVHDVFGVDEAAALVLELAVLEGELRLNSLHGTARAGGGEPDIISVHDRHAPSQPFVARVADESQADVSLALEVRHGAGELLAQVGLDPRLALFDRDGFEFAPRRIVDPGHELGVLRIRTHLRLVGKLEEGIVVPELDLDAPIERASSWRRVRGNRPGVSASIARDRGGRQLELILDLEDHAMCSRFRDCEVVAVDSLRTTGQRDVVGVGDELHRDVLLVSQVVEGLLDLA